MAVEYTGQGVRNLNSLGPRPPRHEALHAPPCIPDPEWTPKGRFGCYVRYCRVCGRVVEERNDRERNDGRR